ncbi:MAG: hypothetical protein A2940_01650 [Candidatus Wildermuthbacteria bacterium RIFCSPLOWO2_01_FULL_48_29]|uniref:Trigger factor n=2 Tax=Candidatus Wildermuthiibacteriota TaxID=1817923 RepID=A0A1G2RLD9_9BACT|nr:MAG: hypothetical protein A2843_01700 [Candidatus Wildermuthbacteria bacterium RIFCSPHIGHO2_01_FULL_48_27b]OHA73646.1 MAG: hypothetical protein A2940_01650 [Candidatus Wildermuthbacteria bacterium RIFCSPLOWO2_01_FULL_48_29]
MKFSKKKLPKSQIALEVQLTPEELDNHREKAVMTLAKDLRLEGFRPGHVPLQVAEKHVGEAAVLSEAARFAIAEVYRNIVEQERLDVIGEPEVRVLKLAFGPPAGGLEFRVQVAVLPDIELPDYKKIAGTAIRKEVRVEEKNVDETLQWLRESRKVKDASGQDVIPEATNEFAKSVGNFADLASLRASIQEGLRHEKEMQERDRLRQEIIEKIAARSKLEIPDVLVEREKQVLLSEVKRGVEQMAQMPFAEYARKAGKTEQELFESFGQEAEQRVKRFLVLREVAKRESITPTPEEVTQEADAILEHYASLQKAKKALDPDRLKEYTEGVLRHEKTLQFLEQFVKS